MKNILKVLKVILFSLSILSSQSCKKDKTPEVITTTITGISQTTATSGGYITINKKTKIVSSGLCWSTESMPTIDNNKTLDMVAGGSFISRITGLTPETTYFVRAYASDSSGTGYGKELSFNTLKSIKVTDADGNVYNAVTIGNQNWMTVNLKTTRYNDGTAIPLVADSTAWSNLNTPGYCWYNNDEVTYKRNYGALYNWYAVNTSKLCPEGWHVPDDQEWTTITTWLGGEDVAGGKLKKTGRSFWVNPNAGATDETGFTALPGGLRYYDGLFVDYGFSGYWWSSTQLSATRAYFRFIYYSDGIVYRFDNIKKIGFSVRCLQD